MRTRALVPLSLAALAGTVHGLWSLYWATGGQALLWTLGQSLVDTFRDRMWLLWPVAAVKIGFALLPLTLALLAWPWRRWSRALCWLGALVLTAWGGFGAVMANLVLAGVLHPDGGYERDGMVGHAWLWDPLFVVWGLSLVVGLLLTRRAGSTAAPREPVERRTV